MTQTNPTCIHLSASSVGSLKACPQRFRLAYREGLRTATDTDSQRMGTNWHALHEVYHSRPTEGDSKWDGNNGVYISSHDRGVAAVTDHLNRQYAECPNCKTIEEWGLERTILLTCFIGYLWYYQNDPIEVLASEVPFDLPLHLPTTGLPLSMNEVVRVGKIDHVIRWQGMVGTMERKSTSRGIGADSDYWDKAKKDTQVSMYALAFQDMRYVTQSGEIWLRNAHSEVLINLGIQANEKFGNTLYDVWHKPTIKPAMLSQMDTTAFLASGEYCGQMFDITTEPHETFEWTPVTIGGESVTIEPGKKGFAIRETLGMYGARLLADIYERPDFYFQRREIARTDAEIKKFRGELFAIYQTMKTFSKSGHWYENEQQCRATFPCQYIPICYGPGADAVCDGQTTPAGFKRIFVDLKVNGESLED